MPICSKDPARLGNQLSIKRGIAKNNSKPSAFVNRISLVNLHDLLITQYNTKFIEKCYEDTKEMSADINSS